MRIAVTMVGLALVVSACGGTGSTTGASAGATTGAGTTTGGASGTGGTTGAATTGGGASTGGVEDAGLPSGAPCTENVACASHVCGMSGSGNCCSIACTSTNTACAPSGCDENGACVYPSMGPDGGAAPACGGTCTNSLLDAFFCDTSGNCSVSTGQAFPCPGNLGCNKEGDACNTSCAQDSDCASGSFCEASICSPRLKTGSCNENDGCVSQACGIDGSGECCTAACAPTKDPSCNAISCAASSGACVFPSGATCGVPACSEGKFNITGDGLCDVTGDCVRTPVQCPDNFGCNAAGTACATACEQRTDCAPGFYCNNDAGGCVGEIPLGSCFENDECTSDFCGTNLTSTGAGNCCAAMCQPTKDPKCDPINCDMDAGGCVYPAGFACGAATCVNDVLSFACTSGGACVANTAACGGHLACNAGGTDCLATCSSDSDCVGGDYYCSPSGACLPRGGAGAPCPINDGCDSQVCGGSTGSGHCCTASCPDTALACAATDCTSKGACIYPTSTTACGTILASCANGIENDPSVCDGAGNCPTPGTTVCAPYICDSATSTCFSSCNDSTSCATGDFCDGDESACCSGLVTGGSITVDGRTGKDAACCGINGNTACLTIGRAMEMIDSAKVQSVTINATVNGGGGTWAPKGESYPITLGWGVELSAPGVHFYDKKADAEIFDIAFYSSNDTVGYASIVGGNSNQVYVGWDENGDQPGASSSIMVEASNTLYIANAEVNGSQNNMTNAITVAAGGTLTLGQDESAGNTGEVNIGTPEDYGWNGIVCQTDSKSLGCTITDANLNGSTAVDIQFQANQDIDAEDFASISLTSDPVVGAINSGAGFGTCGSEYGKPDCSSNSSYPDGTAILLNGDVTMTFSNGTVQCISGYGIEMQATKNGTPTLTMDSTTIQNTEWAIYATAGTATVSNSTIQYNYNGVQQGTDGTNIATIDLSGGSVGGTNTLACFSDTESVDQTNVGVGVFDSTANNINASNCNWDTSGPDQFSCTNDTFTTCTCELSAGCTTAADADGMDAVYDSTGTITTTNNGTASQNCATSTPCNEIYESQNCPPGTVCCPQDPYYPCCEPADLCADYCD